MKTIIILILINYFVFSCALFESKTGKSSNNGSTNTTINTNIFKKLVYGTYVNNSGVIYSGTNGGL